MRKGMYSHLLLLSFFLTVSCTNNFVLIGNTLEEQFPFMELYDATHACVLTKGMYSHLLPLSFLLTVDAINLHQHFCLHPPGGLMLPCLPS